MEWKLEKASVELRPEKNELAVINVRRKAFWGKRKLLCMVELEKEDEWWNIGSWRKQQL